MSWKPALLAWSSMLFLAGLFCANRLPPPHPAWSIAWLGAYGFTHALTLAALLLLFAGLIARVLRGKSGRGLVALVAALFIFLVAADSFAYGVIGFHIDLNSIAYAVQDRATATLGLHAQDFALVGAIAALGGLVGFLVAPRLLLRPALRMLLVCAVLDASFACANAVFRYRAFQPVLGLAEAMPLAWSPRFEGLLFHVFHAPPQSVDGEALFPEPRSRDLSSRTLRTSPWPTHAARTPDILVVAIESLRADSLGEMPRLSSLADTAQVAERHYSSGNCTFEGVFSLLTGLETDYWGARETWRAPRGLGALSSLGYSLELRQGMGTDFEIFGRTVPPDAGQLVQPPPAKSSPERDDESVAWVEDWLGHPADKPRFAFVFLESTHWPYYSRGETEWLGMVDSWARRGLEGRMRERYRSALRETDARLGRVIDALRSSPRGASTVLVITGDHGEAFREHGVFAHGGRLDDEQIRVPFFLVLPGIAAGTIPGPSLHQDLLPTLLGYLGAEPLDRTAGQGIDLLHNEARAAPPLIGTCGTRWSLGYAALTGPDKVLLQIDDRGGHLSGVIGPGDLRRTLAGSHGDLDALLAHEAAGAEALLVPR